MSSRGFAAGTRTIQRGLMVQSQNTIQSQVRFQRGGEDSPGYETGGLSTSVLGLHERARQGGRQITSAASHHPENRLMTSKQATSTRLMGTAEPPAQAELSEDFRNFTSQYGIPVIEKPKVFRSPEGPGTGEGAI